METSEPDLNVSADKARAGRDINIFSVFSKSSSPIASQIRLRDFQTLVEERTRRFVGRQSVISKIDEAIADPDFASGYIVITGEPGIGKTALMAQLVKTRGYVHHFNIGAQNIRSTSAFLGNTCAQLIVRYNLDHYSLPEEATEDSGFLQQILHETIDKTKGRKVIVVVDALDEADKKKLPSSANRLLMPQTLPRGVFFIISMRDKHRKRLSVDNVIDIALADDDPDNMRDVEMYISNFVDDFRAKIEPRIDEWQIKQSTFIKTLAKKSEGNFQYLHYVLPAIRDGKLNKININNVEDLPSGLEEYYQRHWSAMRDHNNDTYKHLQRPVLCFLATAKEPVNFSMLMEWMTQVWDQSLTDQADIRDIVYEWQEFLNRNRSDENETLYSIYHTSFAEFLDNEEGLAQYHAMIARNTLAKVRAMKMQIESEKGSGR